MLKLYKSLEFSPAEWALSSRWSNQIEWAPLQYRT